MFKMNGTSIKRLNYVVMRGMARRAKRIENPSTNKVRYNFVC